jgi:hypothetical protein
MPATTSPDPVAAILAMELLCSRTLPALSLVRLLEDYWDSIHVR